MAEQRTEINGTGTTDPYKDYEAALQAYESRDDMESRKDRLAREHIAYNATSPVEGETGEGA